MRPHQWVKNSLLFVAPFLGGQCNLTHYSILFFPFIAFSLLASSGYLLNDQLDQESDKKHPLKCLRPIARGSLSVPAAGRRVCYLLLLSFGIALILTPSILPMMWIYTAGVLCYNFVFKKIPVLDVFFLALFYPLRISLGAVALHLQEDTWLLGASYFFFLSLAFAKRASEKVEFPECNNVFVRPLQIELLFLLGLLSAPISIFIWIMGPYWKHQNPHHWLGLLIIYAILSRIWILVPQKRIHGDPLGFILKDPFSYYVGIVFFIVLIAL